LLVEQGSDGFNVTFPYLLGGLDGFVAKAVPSAAARHLPSWLDTA